MQIFMPRLGKLAAIAYLGGGPKWASQLCYLAYLKFTSPIAVVGFVQRSGGPAKRFAHGRVPDLVLGATYNKSV